MAESGNMFFDQYNKVFPEMQEKVVPLALKKMQMDIENEKWEIAKAQTIKSIKDTQELKAKWEQALTPKTVTEEVSLPKPTFTPTSMLLNQSDTSDITNLYTGKSKPQSLELGEGLGTQTVTKQVPRSDAEILSIIAPFMNPADYLKAKKDLTGTYEKLGSGDVLINATTGEKVAENTNINTSEKAFQFDEKYRNLVAKEEQGISLAPEDKAWMRGYEKQKQQGVQSVTYLPTTNGLVPVVSKGPDAGKTLPQAPGTEPMRKPLTEAAAKEFSAISTLRKNVSKMRDLYNEKYVGPVMGRVYGIGEQLVNLPENQVMFNSYVNDAKDALLRARSGAQINEQEYARLVKFLPTTELPPKNFEARMKRFEDELDIMLSEKAKVYGEQGFDTSSYIPESTKTVSEEIPKRKAGETVQDYLKRTGGQ